MTDIATSANLPGGDADTKKDDNAPGGGGVLAFLSGFAALMAGGLFLLPTPQAESQAETVGEGALSQPGQVAEFSEDVAPAPEGTLISDFEDGLTSRFGAGWGETTDKIRGGASVATLEVVDGALAVSGEIKAGSMYPWSGAMVFLGSPQMQPVDMSPRSQLVFRVRGDGRQYSTMLFSGDMQGIPPTRTFDTSTEWQTVVFDLDSFYQVDTGRLRAFAFTAVGEPGTFRFEIDDVKIR